MTNGTVPYIRPPDDVPENPDRAFFEKMAEEMMGSFIIYTFYGLTKNSLYDLLDRTLEEKYQMIITREMAKFYHDYVQFHGVRSRKTGGRVLVEIFLEFDPDQRMGEVHQVIESMRESLEGKIENSFVSVSISKEPVR